MRPRTGEREEDVIAMFTYTFGIHTLIVGYIHSIHNQLHNYYNDLCPHPYDNLPKCSLLTLLEEVHLLQSLKVNVHANLRLELVWQGVESVVLVHLVAVVPQVVKPFDDSALTGVREGRVRGIII